MILMARSGAMPGEQPHSFTACLHAVIVSYRRLPLLKACVESFLETVTLPFTLVIVDNGSPADVVRWIAPPCQAGADLGYTPLLLPRNYYPGFATNRGWEMAPPNATLLMRSDNDSIWLPGWCTEMAAAFDDPTVGQYGPIADGDEPWTAIDGWPVGGNSIIRRSLYDQGLRYSETPWPEAKMQEDEALYLAVRALGYRRVWGTRPGLIYNGMRDAEYDREIAEARGAKYP